MNRKQCESLYPDKELLSEEEQKNISGLVDNYLSKQVKIGRLAILKQKPNVIVKITGVFSSDSGLPLFCFNIISKDGVGCINENGLKKIISFVSDPSSCFEGELIFIQEK